MELYRIGVGCYRMRKMMSIKTMKMPDGEHAAQVGFTRMGAWIAVALAVSGLSSTCYAQAANSDVAKHDVAPEPAPPRSPAPADEALPSGNPQTGVLKPPDVDPKMAKPVPDVDPAMDNPPPGKPPAPETSEPPKVQPK